MGETEGIGYLEWDAVVKDCDRQLDQIALTRKNMILGEEVNIKTKAFATLERDKYPKPDIMEEENKPKDDESSETPESE